MKRRLITTGRIVRTGFANFFRNASLALAAMAVMVVTLTIVLFSVVANAALTHTVAQFTGKIDISIYLNNSVTDAQRTGLMDTLKALPQVRAVGYVSKDEALAQYKEANKANKNVLEALNETGGNPLPASIEVTPTDPAAIDQIQQVLGRPEVTALEDAQAGTSYSGDHKKAVDNIARAARILKQVGVVAVIVFGIVSMLIIFNTIQMAIFNRRDEITIMRLLGASTWFIRGPFVVESIVYGVISAFISVGALYLLFMLSSAALQASSFGLLDIGYASSYFYDHFLLLLTLQLTVGIVIGAASSSIATRRYLKFKIR